MRAFPHSRRITRRTACDHLPLSFAATHLLQAHGIVTIPTFPGFSSLNLAQAVLLMCYEWASVVRTEDAPGGDGGEMEGSAAEGSAVEGGDVTRTQLDVAKQAWTAEVDAVDGSSAAAPLKQVDSLFDWWDDTLWRCGFFGGGRGVRSAYGAADGAEQERTRAAAAIGKLRRLLMRAQPSMGEAALLRGALQTMAVPKPGSELAGARADKDNES